MPSATIRESLSPLSWWSTGFQRAAAIRPSLLYNSLRYHQSNGDLVIVDIQGVMEAGRYLLTDPAAHSKERLQYGNLDHGVAGMQKFFSTHECTSLCRDWKKPKIPTHIKSATQKRQEDYEEDEEEEFNPWNHKKKRR